MTTQMSKLEQALLLMDKLARKNAALEQERTEPIAIVGMGCRFPGGAVSPAAFWGLLDAGGDAVQPLEPRWALIGDQPEGDVPRWAGLLTGAVDGFDAAFFGISPREAHSLDPQQRLLLEVAWEGLEDAGISPLSLAGSRTGVFIGALSTDYADLVARQPREERDHYDGTGNLLSVAAGRLSYTLGLEGPCLTIDTACSSSLVAVHQACRSLRARESELALAGGVNMILAPEMMERLARLQALSPDGRCRTFDASANGFVRGEGCGLVVLKRLSDAQRDGDRIWALIRGSAVNQDGRSTGLTAPNVLAQEALLREALQSARVEAGAIGYVETHGTGTSLGDPIEVEALRAVVGPARVDGSNCILGAVKTNIGHLEAAAGVAGLIKAALSLHHEQIPRNLNFRTLNPRLRLEGTALALATEPVAWPRGQKPRFAGVSGFGLSGTNAHVVLEEAPAVVRVTSEEVARGGFEVLPLSARGPAALVEQARRWADFLEGEGAGYGLRDIVHTAQLRRSHLAHRLAVVGRSVADIVEQLRAVEEAELAPAVSRAPRLVFVFPGYGAQWLGMGRRLAATEPVFRRALVACDAALSRFVDYSVLAELDADADHTRMGETSVGQVLTFALQVALATLLQHWGVVPAAVVGHSMGEVAAAHVAGALSLEDAARVIAVRNAIVREHASHRGGMLMVGADVAAVNELVTGYVGRVSVAVVNAPRMLVLSGDLAPLDAIAEQLRARGVFCRRVNVDYASHSAHMDPLLPLLREALSGIEPRAGRIAFCSTVSADFEDGRMLDAGYWAHNLRSPVQFAPAIERLAKSHDIYVEISTHPLLGAAIEETLRERGAAGVAVSLLRRDEDESDHIRRAVARLHERGCAIDFAAMNPAGGRPVPLPTYAWQRERYWLDLGDAPAPASRAPREAPRGDTASVPGRAPASTNLVDRLAAAPESARLRMVEDHVRSRVARTLGLRAHHALDPGAGFAELGLGSLLSLELRNVLSADLGRPLAATLAFDYPTVRALSGYLLGLTTADAAPAVVKPGPVAQVDGALAAIAVVGIGCRLPGGVDDAASFWRLLCAGVDTTRDVPSDRWDVDALHDADPAAPRRMYARRGAFLDQVEGFDAAFFRISPREAEKLDPQQRLLLEVAWEALEDANLPLDPLVGSDTGVFVAGGPSEYRSRLAAAGMAGQDAYGLTGNLSCSLSGRISYVFGFQGPTMTLDTGCSSSLVALHLACQSLRTGETELALAGGVNLIIDPEMTIDLCKSGALAPDGRCKTFGEGADGYARGEGCGLVVLKRLADARRDGDRVLAVIQGTAVNHGGRAAGLTVPSGPAQEALMRKALRQVAVDPAEVGFVETHGTGTDLGDPIEVGALAAVYGRASGRRDPCVLGALKTNVGHLELAAGIAGFIKAVLCVRHGEIPGNVGERALNPKLPLEGAALSFPTELRAWPGGYARRIAAVSSFGMGGTNAHIVVEQAPEEAAAATVAAHAGPVLLPLSARDGAALRVQAERYRVRLASAGSRGEFGDIAYTAALRRAHHAHRLAVVAQDADEAAGLLQAWLGGEARAAVVAGRSAPGRRRLAFVFSGQGSQWVGMGRQLYARDGAFRAAMDACDAAIRVHSGWSVLAELAAAAGGSRLESVVDVIQPAIFAVQVALAAALRERGIVPDVVIGHSMGEVAAARVAGALSLDDAARIICTRSRVARERASGNGGMALVELSRAEAEAAIADRPTLSVAVHNSPTSTVLSGDAVALEQVLGELERRDVWLRRIKVDYASHSPQMDALLPELRGLLAGVRPGVGEVSLFSTVTGALVQGPELDASYWADNLRRPVRFCDAIAALAEDGVDVFLEISPHPVLVQSIADTLAFHGREGVTLGSLRREGDELATLLTAVGGLHTAGCVLDWAKIAPAGRPVALPAYPWQRRRYWIEHRVGRELRPGEGAERAVTPELPAESGTDHPATPADGWLRTVLAQAGREQRGVLLAAHLREQLAGVLGISAAEIDPRTPLPMMGLDSLMGTELRRRLERSLGRPLSPTLILRHPTLDAMTAYIVDLDGAGPEDSQERARPAPAGEWVVVPRPEPRARLQLVCFHYAGGGASMYRDWPALLGPQVEVCAVQLPGREERIDEPALTRMEPLLDALVERLLPRLRGPFVCFGHSMGALVAVELARRLAAQGRPGPAHLFLSGCPGPAAHVPGEALHGLGDAEFRAALRRHGGTPEVVLRDEGLMELLVPLLRADFGVAERWDYRPGPALQCSITGFAGEEDGIAGPAQVQAFAAETAGRFELRRFPGGHFFVNSERAAVVAAVRAELVRSGLIGEPTRGEPVSRPHIENGARV